MILYEQEKKDGLSDLILNQSIAYEVQVKPSNANLSLPNNLEHPLLASAGSEDWDLFHFNSVLVSVGWNKNDDVFDSNETWAAKDTPVLKKVNYNHDEKDIIGVILASTAVDQEGNIIKKPLDQFDLVVSAVLYKKWEDEALQERMDTIIEEIAKGEWYVSMECLFRAFDYALVDDEGNSKIVERSEATSFLTKHLRWYGGTGTWDKYTVGRYLKNFTFSGKGIVKKPANDRSIILTKAFIADKTEKYIMDPKDVQIDQLKEALTKAEAKIEKLGEDLAQKVQAAQEVEKTRLEKQLEKQNLTIADLQEEVKTLKSEVETKDEEVSKASKSIKELTDNLSVAQEKVQKAEKFKKESDRKEKMVKVGVDEAKAMSLVEKFDNLSDEQFDEIVELNKKTKAAQSEESNETADLSTANTETVVTVVENENNQDDDVAELQQALASWAKEIVNTPFKK